MKYKILEHPGDYKIRVFGKDLPELFSNAALGMMEFLYSINNQQSTVNNKKEVIKLKSKDLKALLVDWLSELLYLSDVNNLAYTWFNFKKLTKTGLEAEVFGFPTKPKDDIKAATYHGLEINKTAKGWEAIILFDI